MSSDQPGAAAKPPGAVAADGPKRRRRLGLLPLLLLLLLLALVAAALIALLSGGKSHKQAAATHTTPPSTPAASPPAAPPAAVSPKAAAGSPSAASLRAGSTAILPLPAGRTLRAYLNRPVRAHSVRVQSVTSDAGFWVGPGPRQRVFVQLPGEQSPPVSVGDHVSFTGRLRPGPPDLDKARGITPADGAAQIEHEGGFVKASGIRRG